MSAISKNASKRSALVVGSGFGGLAVAIRLQAMGIQTTVSEARDKPGGRAYVFEDQGYTFDAGPTVITAPPCLEELFEVAGRRIEDYVTLLPVSPMYRLQWPDGDYFDYVNDPDQMENQIRQRTPDDADGYRRFLEYTRQVFDKGYTELGAEPFPTFWAMVRVAPHLMRLRADRSVYQAVSKFIQNDRIRQALSFHSLLVGGHPYETSAIYTLIHHLERTWGVYFPKGGTGALVQSLVKLFQELGGTLELAAPVEKMMPIQSSSGSQIIVSTPANPERTFDVVVSNADVHHTYADLLKDDRSAQKRAKQLEAMRWSMSLFVLYFGTDRRYDVCHHTILFGSDYKKELDKIFHGHELPESLNLYLHAPTVTDPSLAPPGGEAFYVLCPVPHLGQTPNLHWSEQAEPFADKILSYLEKHGLENLRQHVVTKRWMTPEDFRDQLHGYMGSAFSVSPTLRQSAWFRPHNRDERIKGLYLVGAGTHPGAGIPGTVNSAKATAKLVAQDLAL